MSATWGLRILAGEANKPGSCSEAHCGSILVNLDESDARLFSALCGYCWSVHGPVPLLYDYHAEIYAC